jgi:hypothetical protein
LDSFPYADFTALGLPVETTFSALDGVNYQLSRSLSRGVTQARDDFVGIGGGLFGYACDLHTCHYLAPD